MTREGKHLLVHSLLRRTAPGWREAGSLASSVARLWVQEGTTVKLSSPASRERGLPVDHTENPQKMTVTSPTLFCQ